METMRLLGRLLTVIAILVTVAHMPVLVGAAQTEGQTKYAPVVKYDPQRDAAQDIRDAVNEAQRTHKRILLEVGGNWCSWCHTLDRFFETHSELTEFRDRNFVTLKINFSDENENKEVLSRYGEIAAYPHLFVVESDGKLLLSKDTGALESGKSYDLVKLTAFLKEWAPSR